MRLAGVSRLDDFAGTHANSSGKLEGWRTTVMAARWRTFPEVQQTFNTASYVDPWVIFNVGGNRYRVITRVEYQSQTVFIRCVQTHAEYNKTNWKR